MARKKGKGSSRKKSIESCEDFRHYIDCRCLPHGFFSLIPAVLSTMAFWTSLVQDGCDYTKLEGGNVEKITGSDVYPFIEAGIAHYRAPIYYTSDNEWKKVFTSDCQDYPEHSMDIFWKLAKYLTLISSIFAGSLAMFLWFTTCLTFSIRTWRFCAVEAVLAALCRAGSFFYFLSSICTGNQSTCHLAFGSTMDILSIVLLIVTALAMFGHYPDPKLRQLTDEEIIQSVAEAENLQPKRLLVGSHSSAKRSMASAGGESSRYMGGVSGRSLGGGASTWHPDNQSHYTGDNRSVASKSLYKKGYVEEQSVASRSHYNSGEYADDGYNDGQSLASQSNFSFSKDRSGYFDDSRSVASQSYYSVSKETSAFV